MLFETKIVFVVCSWYLGIHYTELECNLAKLLGRSLGDQSNWLAVLRYTKRNEREWIQKNSLKIVVLDAN